LRPHTGCGITKTSPEHGQSDSPLLQLDQERLELTHADIGGWLASAWHLPTALREPIQYHHKPGAAQEAVLQTAIVHVADILAKGMGCNNPGDDHVPPLSREAWDLLGLDDAALALCLAKASHEFATIDDYL
jgi:HD-like signal output (HDOD) protein